MIEPCNLCGLPCGDEHDNELGLIRQAVRGRYASTPGNGSGALDDCSVYTFSLCEFCLDWLFTQFRTPPKVERWRPFSGDIEAGSEEPFRPAAVRVREDVWRCTKDAFFAESEKRAAARSRRAPSE